jgi:HPt (histidine-containing phosphotransfer) domain-containing protein
MQVFDRAHFAHMTGADAALQAEVAALFRAQVEEWRDGLARLDRDTVHTLKGSARGIGLEALAAACEAAEKNPDAAGALAAALDEALAALAAFPGAP